jgi:hypothetical protein
VPKTTDSPIEGGPNPTLTGERTQRQTEITGAIGTIVVLSVDVCERLVWLLDEAFKRLADRNGGRIPVSPDVADAISLLRAGAYASRTTAGPGLTAVGAPAAAQRKSKAEVAEVAAISKGAHGVLVGTRGAADLWGCDPHWVRDLAGAGELPATRVGSGRWVLPGDFVRAYTTVAAARAAHLETLENAA